MTKHLPLTDLTDDLIALGWSVGPSSDLGIVATLSLDDAGEGTFQWISIAPDGFVRIDCDGSPEVWDALARIKTWQAAR